LSIFSALGLARFLAQNTRVPVRKIVHVDMDAFYASVEQRDDPALRGRPVAVGGRPESRGVVAAASYEARAHGVRSAMPMARAMRLCPGLAVVPPDFPRYKAVSTAVFTIFRTATPLVEPMSLDEAYLDVTENAWGEPLGVEVARRLKREIRTTTGLTASAGVAANKLLAKIASAWKKPDGLTVIAPDRADAFLERLGVEALWGVGPVTAGKLHARGWRTVGDLRAAPEEDLSAAIGSAAEWIRPLAFGLDDRPVVAERPWKSVSCENTFAKDLTDPKAIASEVEELSRRCARRLGGIGLFARTVVLKLRYSDFETVTRSHTAPPTRAVGEIAQRAVALLRRTAADRRPVRLLGVGVHGLSNTEEGSQLSLPVGLP
jgi:DNA polymerase IV